MVLAPSHGNVIVLKAGADLFAIEVRFSNQSERSCYTFDQSQSQSSRLFPRFLKVLYLPALSTILTIPTFASSFMLFLSVFFSVFLRIKRIAKCVNEF